MKDEYKFYIHCFTANPKEALLEVLAAAAITITVFLALFMDGC